MQIIEQEDNQLYSSDEYRDGLPRYQSLFYQTDLDLGQFSKFEQLLTQKIYF